MAQKDIDLKKIKELIEIMKQNGLEELEIRQDDDKIYLKRSQPQAAQGPAITSFPVMKQEFGPAPVAAQDSAAAGQPADPVRTRAGQGHAGPA